ncbi:hypothetical protein vseg_001676 [Gypsophila vaccaria]
MSEEKSNIKNYSEMNKDTLPVKKNDSPSKLTSETKETFSAEEVDNDDDLSADEIVFIEIDAQKLHALRKRKVMDNVSDEKLTTDQHLVADGKAPENTHPSLEEKTLDKESASHEELTPSSLKRKRQTEVDAVESSKVQTLEFYERKTAELELKERMKNWLIRKMPRPNKKRTDTVYIHLKTDIQFRSMTEVDDFIQFSFYPKRLSKKLIIGEEKPSTESSSTGNKSKKRKYIWKFQFARLLDDGITNVYDVKFNDEEIFAKN